MHFLEVGPYFPTCFLFLYSLIRLIDDGQWRGYIVFSSSVFSISTIRDLIVNTTKSKVQSIKFRI